VKNVGLFDAKNRFSEICEQVSQTGEPLIVTRRGRPLVRIVPVEREEGSVWDTVHEGLSRFGPIEEELELPDRQVTRNRPSPLE
jgi:prevent-host-death family protein